MSETSKRVLARLQFITDESVRQNSTNVLAREVEVLEARVAEVEAENARLRAELDEADAGRGASEAELRGMFGG